MNRRRAFSLILICSLSIWSLSFLATGVAAAQSTTETERGIPVDDPLIISKCAGCHARDANGMMRRISYVRTTPEVWEQILKRMIRLNGLETTPEESRHILRYLSSNNGLSPQEAKPVFWEAEHRLFRTQEEEGGAVPSALQLTCNQCHTIGRVLSQRRTAADYVKLANTHMALFPGSEPMVFRPQERYAHPEDIPVTVTQLNEYESELNYPPAPPKNENGTTRYPIDVALEYLAKNQPLVTPDWVAWKGAIQAPKLAGTWLVSAYQPGRGKVYGETTIEATSTADDFVTKTVLHYPDGQVVTSTGKGIVYAGYSWRGHATAAGGAKDPAFPADSREAMLLSADGNTLDGRWFWGGYQEFGLDVQLTRLQRNPVILGFDQFSVQSPSSSDLHIYGANLPVGLTAGDFDLGKGVQITKVVRSTPTEVALQVTVAAGLPAAPHKVMVKGMTAPQTLTVYGKVDYIKVSPDADFARLGGTIAPKQYAIFQALGFANGEDGKPGTADDIPLGPLTAAWSLEEFYSTPKDDDVKYVGSIADTGVFTPNLEGPNPSRRKQSNNYPTENWGDVYVDALYKTATGETLKARSYLVVGVPQYMHYDQPEVGQ
jgi:quinohemoprotein amine dehydrogenase